MPPSRTPRTSTRGSCMRMAHIYARQYSSDVGLDWFLTQAAVLNDELKTHQTELDVMRINRSLEQMSIVQSQDIQDLNPTSDFNQHLNVETESTTMS
ncbi:hypothetical protein DSO57_1004818 [Entomophthora muscae]|nr:hypothetical protein DSO57_1004818 [Entomophthora muscae]